MFRHRFLLAAFAVAVLALVLPVQAGEKSDAKVKVTAKASKIGADGKQTVTFTIDIEKDWYIYANPVGDELFDDNKTRVTIKAKEKVDANVVYPTGKMKVDGKIRYNVYEKSVVIEAMLKRTAGDTQPRCNSASMSIRAARKRHLPADGHREIDGAVMRLATGICFVDWPPRRDPGQLAAGDRPARPACRFQGQRCAAMRPKSGLAARKPK